MNRRLMEEVQKRFTRLRMFFSSKSWKDRSFTGSHPQVKVKKDCFQVGLLGEKMVHLLVKRSSILCSKKLIGCPRLAKVSTMDRSRSGACGETFGKGWLGEGTKGELLLRSDNKNKWLLGWWDEVSFLVGKVLTSNNSPFFDGNLEVWIVSSSGTRDGWGLAFVEKSVVARRKPTNSIGWSQQYIWRILNVYFVEFAKKTCSAQQC